jgi:SPP1 family predicted phage head-tail adaptor
MRTGDLNKYILLHKPIMVNDKYGSKKKGFELQSSVRAKVDWVSGFRDNINGEISSCYTLEAYVYNYIKVTETHRIEYDGKMYKVDSIIPEGRLFKKLTLVEVQV